jgi:hypothetical protein
MVKLPIKTKITIHFIVNITIFESLLFEDIHVNVVKLCILTNFELVHFLIWALFNARHQSTHQLRNGQPSP